MSTGYLLLSALVGWCGTLWPRWWWPRPPRPVPPDPEPWWRTSVIAVVGGLVGGFLASEFLTLSVLPIAFGAFAGGVAALGIAERLDQKKETR